jgi:hypothetical protein
MKQRRITRLSVLLIGLAVSSPKVMAQLVPAADRPSANAAAVRTSSDVLSSSPIVAYTPPTEKEKLRLFEFDAFGPYAFAKAALAGGFQQATKSPPEWGTGWDAFGSRVASNFGIQLVTTTTRYGMAEIFREDTAYYRCECKGFFPRFSHALISTVTGRHGADGHTAFSLSGLVAPYAGTMTAMAWYPDRYGVKDGFRMGNYNLAGEAGENLALEFIYGGPHTLFRHFRGSQSPDRTASNQNP